MKLLNSHKKRVAAALIAGALAIPAISQDSPESILPPGFGDVVEEPETPKRDTQPKLDIDLPEGDEGDRPARTSSNRPSGGSDRPSSAAKTVAAVGEDGEKSDKEGEEGGEGEGRPIGMRELPPEALRSTDVVGVIDSSSGDLGLNAFQGMNGRFLSSVMRKTDAPIASRWASILLRRALLSTTATPADVNGADWTAERAWLLLRMGEADPARMLVQAVDTDNYTPKMMQVAMQASLATADPTGICPYAERGEKEFAEASWTLARAMCFALSGEGAQANAMIDRLRDAKKARGIDVLLAEKVAAAGANSRRAIVIQWERVQDLTAWRFGLANAVGVEVPQPLLGTVGPQVVAWQARSPLTPIGERVTYAERAAAMGVLSGSALNDLYGAWFEATDPSEHRGKAFSLLRAAYVGNGEAARLASMKALWDEAKLPADRRYARLILTSRAASILRPSETLAADADRIIGSMMAAGMDKSAARWAKVATDGDSIKAWALLAVGAPTNVVEVSSGQISSFQSATSEHGGQLLFAALAGLGRLSADSINDLAEDYGVPVGRKSKWTQTLNLAADRGASGAVAVIAAAGLQTRDWNKVPPAHLYHILSALRRVGLEAEARMIAAEAVSRS